MQKKRDAHDAKEKKRLKHRFFIAESGFEMCFGWVQNTSQIQILRPFNLYTHNASLFSPHALFGGSSIINCDRVPSTVCVNQWRDTEPITS